MSLSDAPGSLGIAGALLISAQSCSCTYAEDAGPLAAYRPRFIVVDTNPRPLASDVATSAHLQIRFNTAPDPLSLTSRNIRLVSGKHGFAVDTDVDLLDRMVRIHPRQPMRSRLRYSLIVDPSVESLEGGRLADPLVLTFVTDGARPAAIRQPTPTTAADLQPVWQQHCVRCHSGTQPPGAVDLSSAQRARQSLVGRRSKQIALDRVTPRSHALSYLMRKMLRVGFVGLPMPPDVDNGPTAAELRRVADWIDLGAQ